MSISATKEQRSHEKRLFEKPILPAGFNDLEEFFRQAEQDAIKSREALEKLGPRPPRPQSDDSEALLARKLAKRMQWDELSARTVRVELWLIEVRAWETELYKRLEALSLASLSEVAERQRERIDARLAEIEGALTAFERFYDQQEKLEQLERSKSQLTRKDSFKEAHWWAYQEYAAENGHDPKPKELWLWMESNATRLPAEVRRHKNQNAFVYRGSDGKLKQMNFSPFASRHRRLREGNRADKHQKPCR